MEDAIQQAVERVITTMQENLGEQLTIDDMARTAMFSKFHFSRVFQRVTGVSPGRFLSALRLQEAKQLLVSTTLTVAEISHRVGYTSIGTFSSRFRSSVGVSPTTYRQLGGAVAQIPVDHGTNGGRTLYATVRGHVWCPSVEPLGPVFVGLFPGRVPQGTPAGCTVLPRPGPYEMERVPAGTWYLLAHAVAPDAEDGSSGQETLVGFHGPITICRDMGVRWADLWLRPKRIVDPPILLAPLDSARS